MKHLLHQEKEVDPDHAQDLQNVDDAVVARARTTINHDTIEIDDLHGAGIKNGIKEDEVQTVMENVKSM